MVIGIYSVDQTADAAPLYGVVTTLACSNSYGIFNRGDEDFSVADSTGLCRLLNGFNGSLKHRIIDDNLDFDLGQKIDNIFSAAI